MAGGGAHTGPTMGNGSESAGGGGKTDKGGTKKTDEKVNPKAVYEWVVVRWFSTEVKAADVEKALDGKSFVKGYHTHADDKLACVNYFGELKDVDQVKKLVAGGNSVIVTPAKVHYTLKPVKGVKDADSKKCRDKVCTVKGTIFVDSASAGTSLTIYIDPSKFDWRKAKEAAKSEGFDIESDTHELITVAFKFTKQGQIVDPLKKEVFKQKGVMFLIQLDDMKGTITVIAEKGNVKDDAFKQIIEKAGFTAGDVTRE